MVGWNCLNGARTFRLLDRNVVKEEEEEEEEQQQLVAAAVVERA